MENVKSIEDCIKLGYDSRLLRLIVRLRFDRIYNTQEAEKSHYRVKEKIQIKAYAEGLLFAEKELEKIYIADVNRQIDFHNMNPEAWEYED